MNKLKMNSPKSVTQLRRSEDESVRRIRSQGSGDGEQRTDD
jgi:hypothetical protein